MAFTAFMFWIVAGIVYVIIPPDHPVLARVAELAKWTFIVALAAWFYLSK